MQAAEASRPKGRSRRTGGLPGTLERCEVIPLTARPAVAGGRA